MAPPCAAQKLGDRQKAMTYYKQLLAITDGTNSGRREIGEARKFLGARRYVVDHSPVLFAAVSPLAGHCGPILGVSDAPGIRCRNSQAFAGLHTPDVTALWYTARPYSPRMFSWPSIRTNGIIHGRSGPTLPRYAMNRTLLTRNQP